MALQFNNIEVLSGLERKRVWERQREYTIAPEVDDPDELTACTIPAEVTNLSTCMYGLEIYQNLAHIEVEEGNPVFASADGILYNKNITTLLRCPRGREGHVIVPEGVKRIGFEAFKECSMLTGITLPETLEEIWKGAFYDCWRLEEVIIPPKVTCLEEKTFYDCDSLSRVILPEGLESIRDWAFVSCDSLCQIDIPDSVTEIEKDAFLFCGPAKGPGTVPQKREPRWNYLVRNGEVTITGGLETSGRHEIPAFLDGCPVTAINGRAFWRCENMEEVVIPSGVTTIGYNAFCDCTALRTVRLPETLKELGAGVFSGCTALEELRLPDGPLKLSGHLFENTKIKSVTVPAGVEEMWDDSFGGCDELEEILVAEGNDRFVSVDGVLYNRNMTHLVRCPQGKKGHFTVPDTVVKINKNAFSGCRKLTGLTISKGVTVIGNSALSELCLSEIQLPEGLKRLGNWVFAESSITRLVLPAGVRHFGWWLCKTCKELNYVELPADLHWTPNDLFVECDALEELRLPEKCIHFDPKCASDLKNLKRLSISEENAKFTCVDGILYSKDMTELVSCPRGREATVTIPETVTGIHKEAFAECEKLTGVILPAGLKYIGEAAFKGCTALTQVTLPEHLAVLGRGAFCGCTGLESITIPASLRFLGMGAFYQCPGAEGLDLPECVAKRHPTKSRYCIWDRVLNDFQTRESMKEVLGNGKPGI